MDKYYLILDLGMTKTTTSLFDAKGQPVSNYFHVVPSRTKEGEAAVYENSRKALDHIIAHFDIRRENIAGIGVGAPGPLDPDRGIILDSPMMGAKNFHFADALERDYGVQVRMDNDGNLGALAEQRSGKGHGKQNVLYMTVSTGCGGGAVLNGQLYRGHADSAAEFGHISIEPDGPLCPCGNHGCVEMLASGTAINRKIRADMAAGRKSLAFDLAEHDPEKLKGPQLAEAASQGDEYALAVYRQEGVYLGRALAVYFNLFDPDVFVLGGGVTKAKAYFHEEMMRELRERTIMPIEDDRVQYSEMNDTVVSYGAYYLIKEYEDAKK